MAGKVAIVSAVAGVLVSAVLCCVVGLRPQLSVEPPAPPSAGATEGEGRDLHAPTPREDVAVSRTEVATGTLRLRVVDEDGRGVAGAPILVFFGSQQQGTRSTAALRTVTGSTGSVEKALPCGAFTVLANPAGGDRRWNEAVAEVVVEAGQVAAAELRVREASASLLVRVRDDTGEPVENVRVRVLPAGSSALLEPEPGVEQEVWSFTFRLDGEPRTIPLPTPVKDGIFLTRERLKVWGRAMEVDPLGGLAQAHEARRGTYLVHAAGWSVQKTDGTGVARFSHLVAGDHVVSLFGKRTLRAAVRQGTSQRVTMIRGRPAEVDFRLPPSGIVSLRVTGPDTLAEGCIRLTGLDGVFDSAGVSFPFGRGVLRASWLPPGRYAVSCELSPGAPVVARTPRQVVVSSGQITDVVVDLLAAKAVLAGRVVDAAHRPMAGVGVQAAAVGYEPKLARTGPSGDFAIRGLPAAPWRVQADAVAGELRGPDATPRPSSIVDVDPTRATEAGIVLCLTPHGTVLVPPRDAASQR